MPFTPPAGSGWNPEAEREMEEYIGAFKVDLLTPYPDISTSLGLSSREVKLTSDVYPGDDGSPEGEIKVRSHVAVLDIIVWKSQVMVEGRLDGKRLSLAIKDAKVPDRRQIPKVKSQILRYIEDQMPEPVYHYQVGGGGCSSR